MARGKGGAGKAKVKPKQQSLEQAGQLPLLKKPGETVGKPINVIGSHWGSACPQADKDKQFVCVVKEYTLLHTFSPAERGPAMQLLEMGVDAKGGDSEPFWMKYPYPFLEFWYKAYPLEAAPAERTATAEADPAAAAEASPHEKSRSLVYDYLDPVRSERKGGRQINVFACNVMVPIGCGIAGEKKCGASCTLFGKTTGPYFKHVRRMQKNGCGAHAALAEVLNLSSSRQVRLLPYCHTAALLPYCHTAALLPYCHTTLPCCPTATLLCPAALLPHRCPAALLPHRCPAATVCCPHRVGPHSCAIGPRHEWRLGDCDDL
jgi:hypothetical protein